MKYRTRLVLQLIKAGNIVILDFSKDSQRRHLSYVLLTSILCFAHYFTPIPGNFLASLFITSVVHLLLYNLSLVNISFNCFYFPSTQRLLFFSVLPSSPFPFSSTSYHPPIWVLIYILLEILFTIHLVINCALSCDAFTVVGLNR